ncbi:uncharacterized protein [Henckelia pumila]|uniref:uncharacterized protein n=1 Tax=Henckelia pumila TaxID=405737 RepID=UPI003C6E383F
MATSTVLYWHDICPSFSLSSAFISDLTFVHKHKDPFARTLAQRIQRLLVQNVAHFVTLHQKDTTFTRMPNNSGMPPSSGGMIAWPCHLKGVENLRAGIPNLANLRLVFAENELPVKTMRFNVDYYIWSSLSMFMSFPAT